MGPYSFLLNAIYLGLLVISMPWLAWRLIRYGKNRRGWSQKLFGQVPIRAANNFETAPAQAERQRLPNSTRSQISQCIWLHAVSVGEVNLLAPIIERLQNGLPEFELVVSTSTETGYDLAQKKYQLLKVFFFPFDFTWSVRRALKRIRPSLIVLAELEVWPNFIRCAASFPVAKNGSMQLGIPIAVVNGRLSEKSLRGYQRWGFWLKTSFRRLALIAAQDEVYAQRFIQVGAEPSRVMVTGSVKFDGVQTDRDNSLTRRLRELTGFGDQEFVFLAGSTQLEEDQMAAKVYQSLMDKHPQLRLILAPRHPQRCHELVNQLQHLGLEVVRRSSLTPQKTLAVATSNPQAILLIDVIGELGGWWGVADAAYVGGSMGSRGGQNMIEPAAYGIPISFGPHTQNFRAIVEQLLAVRAAVVVSDQQEWIEFVMECLTNSVWAEQMGGRAQALVNQHRGAADRTVGLLKQLLASSG